MSLQFFRYRSFDERSPGLTAVIGFGIESGQELRIEL
jgi:hypothetical protein